MLQNMVKNLFGLFFRYCILASSYLQVIQTSTVPSQQFSAPFKAVNTTQAQTCNISYNGNTKKSATLELVHTSSGETKILMTLTNRVSK